MTYSENILDHNRVYIAVAISMMAHIVLVFILLQSNHTRDYIDNGIQAMENVRVSLNITKMKPVEKVIPKPVETQPIIKETLKPEVKKPIPVKQPKPEKIKPTPQTPPIAETQPFVEKQTPKENVDENQKKKAIPMIENASFKGKRTPPKYPKRAEMLKQEGTVFLKALIDIDGNIKDVQVITSSGYAILDKSAMKAVKQWEFNPSVIDGKPSISWVKVPVQFVLR